MSIRTKMIVNAAAFALCALYLAGFELLYAIKDL